MAVESLKTYDMVKRLSAEHYANQEKEMKSGRPFAWGMAFCPEAIPRSMGMEVVLAEPYGMTCVAGGFAAEFNRAVDEYGFGCDMCGYGRNFVGSYLLNKGPLNEMRKPSFMIGIKLGCNDHLAWLETLSQMSGVPFFGVDVPSIHGDVEARHVDYVLSQLLDLTRFIEKTTGVKAEGAKVAQTVIYRHQALVYWSEILDRCKNVPSPLTWRNMISFMHPSVHMRGKKEAADLYKSLLDELDDRLKRGIKAAEGEKVRLLWDNVPFWYHMDLYRYLAKREAEVVVSFYTTLMGERLPISPCLSDKGRRLLQWETPNNLSEALRELAKFYLTYNTYENLPAKLAYYEKMVKEWHVDGAIFHANMGCKGLSLGRKDVVNYLRDDLKIPVLEIEGNMGDARYYDKEKTTNEVAGFIDQLEVRRK